MLTSSRERGVSKNALSQQNLPIGFEVEATMSKVSMPKATTAIVSLLVVACVFAFSRWFPAALAASGIVSALFLVLLLVLAKAGVDSRSRRRGGRRLLRYAAPALLVLLGPALVWAGGFSTTFPGVTTVLPTPGITLGQTQAVAVDSLGNVYIADVNNNRIVEVNAAGVASVVAFPGLSPALSTPEGVAVDGSGNLYVSDAGNLRVIELSTEGVASVVNTGALINPCGMGLDAAGDLYIADSASNHIVEVPAGGAGAVLVITGLGTALSGPRGVVVDLLGNLYIADNNNNRIVKVTTPAGGTGAGTVLTITGLSPALNGPFAVALDGLGNLYIADNGNNRIVTVTPAGAGAVLNLGSYTLNIPRGVAVSVWGAVYIADNRNTRIVEAQPTTVGFGHLPTGAVSGTILTLPFTIAQGTTLGSVQALTEGASGLDFTVVSAGTTCISGVTNTACNVVVQFLPTAPGLRRGEVVLFNNASTPAPIMSVPLYAIADAPLAALSPGTASLASVGGATLSAPFQIAFDGAGNMYVANYGSVAGNVVKVPAGGGNATVVSTGGFILAGAIGVVLDGAGNLYISDHENNRILEVTAGGVVSALNITGLSTGLSIPAAIAMDAAGNLYISDYGNGRIVKVTPAGVGSVVAAGSFTFPSVSVLGVAVDVAGTVYIPDSQGNRVVKVTASGAASLVVPAGITPILSSPHEVAVDAFGNLYIADAGNRRIVEITTAGVASVVQMPGQTLVTDYGVTVDNSGNVFIPDFSANHIVNVSVAGANLTFPNTNVGSASSPQTATVTNIGDLPLVFAASPAYTPDFSQPTGATDQCLISTSLDAGTVCDVSVQFTPQSAASLSASIVVTDNNLNVSNATQTVAVSGTGISVGDTTAVAVSTNPTAASIGQPLTITAIVTDTATGHTATIPTGGVTFMDTVGSTTISLNGGAAVPLNGTGMAILGGVTLTGAGVHTITANYVGVAGTFLTSSNTTTLTISLDTATVAGPATQPVQVANGQAGSVPVTVTGPYSVSVVAAPTGSLTYTVVNSSSVNVASGTAPLTAGSTNSTATVPLASSLAPGSYTVSVTYGGDANYAASASATTIQVMVGLIVPTVNWAQPAPITYGATLSGILNATAVNGSTVVPGSFSYTATPQGGSAGAVNSSTILGAGSYTLTATFTPTDPTTYASANASVSLAVAQAAPVVGLISSSNPVLVSAAVTFTATVSSTAGTPGGSVSFYDGATLLGTSTLTLGVAAYATSSLALGAHSITAAYGGNSNFSALTSAVLTETVTAPTTIATTITLTASPNPLADGQPATLTATVTPAPTGSSAGTISFYSGATLLGTETLNTSGVARFTTSSLVVGADSVTAAYPGNAGYAASTSSAVSETVTTAYTVAGPTTPVMVAPGGAAIIDITVPPLGGAFDNVVTLSATGLPPGASATFNPATVTPGSAGASAVLTIQLATTAANNLGGDVPARRQGLPVAPLSLGFVLFGAVLGRKRIPRTLALAAVMLLGVAATLLVTGCGNGPANPPSTPAGNYTVTVTGTSGSYQASTTVTLTVQ
jgi:sugar lactone lactonase YvrE